MEENILAKLAEMKQQPDEVMEQQQPALVYLLAGVIVGVISAVIMVAMINKSNASLKKKRIAQESNIVMGKVDEEKLC